MKIKNFSKLRIQMFSDNNACQEEHFCIRKKNRSPVFQSKIQGVPLQAGPKFSFLILPVMNLM